LFAAYYNLIKITGKLYLEIKNPETRSWKFKFFVNLSASKIMLEKKNVGQKHTLFYRRLKFGTLVELNFYWKSIGTKLLSIWRILIKSNQKFRQINIKSQNKNPMFPINFIIKSNDPSTFYSINLNHMKENDISLQENIFTWF
jgi:hypothetical protein